MKKITKILILPLQLFHNEVQIEHSVHTKERKSQQARHQHD